MGLINSTPQGKMNPLLQKTEQSIEAKINPKDKPAYQRIVLAGMKIAFDQSTHSSLVQGLAQSQDPVHDVAIGVVGLLLIMNKQAKGTMPVPPMILAGMTLVLHGLDFLQQAKGMNIGPNEIDTATKLYVQTISPKVGLSPQVMQDSTTKAQGAMQNQQFMAKYKQSQGAQNGTT